MSSRSKGNRTVREKAVPFYEKLGFFVAKVEVGGKFAKEKDLYANIFDDHEENYTASGFDLICLNEEKVIFVQVTTNSPKTQKWYKAFARMFARRDVEVHVFTHYDNDGFRVQNYLPDGSIDDTDYRLSKNPHAKRSFWWWEDNHPDGKI